MTDADPPVTASPEPARPNLLILDDHEGILSGSPGADRLRAIADVTVLGRPLTDVDDAELADVSVLLAIRERTRLDAATLSRFPSLELVLQTGGHAYHVDVDEVLAVSDVLSVHLRLSDQSRGLLDGKRLRRIKPGSVLVNTARGAIVDEAALVEVLQDGPLSAAGLDVFVTEPLPAESPLRGLPNVVLTPHLGWTVEEVFVEFAAIAADQLEQYLHGELDPAELLDPEVAQIDRARFGGVAGAGGAPPR